MIDGTKRSISISEVGNEGRGEERECAVGRQVEGGGSGEGGEGERGGVEAGRDKARRKKTRKSPLSAVG